MVRVVQWGAGITGSYALEAIIAHPDLELVGVRVYRDEKVGRDAGELVGVAPVGVKATNRNEDILALDADCVVYMADKETDPMGGLDDICALLASGKNVVSTAVTPLIYPASMGPEVVERIEKACAEGQSSFHGTGIEPGWAAEVLPLTMSGVVRRIDSILVQELLDYASWDNAEMLFNNMGFGKRPDEKALWDAEIMGKFLQGPMTLVIDALGATIERFEYHRDVWLAEKDFEIAAGTVKAGTVAAAKFGTTAVVDGRPAFVIEHVTRLTQDAAPEWPTGQGWRVTIEGLPSMMMEARIGLHGGEDQADQACLATAMHAVHTVIPLSEADPGIRTVLDMRMVVGRHTLDR